jgi:hypothetical protein
VGAVDLSLARALQAKLGLQRAIETGTYLGDGALALSGVFSTVVTIEISTELRDRAASRLANRSNIRLLQGHSVDHLAGLAAEPLPTLYFLDGHWSAGFTAGEEDECPVLEELAAIGAGSPNDCLIVDDARLFAAPPPPPHDPSQWPTLLEVLDAIRRARPEHHVTVIGDQFIAVPASAREVVDHYGQDLAASQVDSSRSLRSRIHSVAESLVRLRDRVAGKAH